MSQPPDNLHTNWNVRRNPVVVSMYVISLDEMLATFIRLRAPNYAYVPTCTYGLSHYAWLFICTDCSKWPHRIDSIGICYALIQTCLSPILLTTIILLVNNKACNKIMFRSLCATKFIVLTYQGLLWYYRELLKPACNSGYVVVIGYPYHIFTEIRASISFYIP